MQIPNTFRPFAHKTLVVVFDAGCANIFLADGSNFDRIQTLTPDEPTDNERISVTTPDGHTFSEDIAAFDQKRDEAFFASIAPVILHAQKEQAARLLLVSSPEHLKSIQTYPGVSPDSTIPKILTKVPDAELFIHIC